MKLFTVLAVILAAVAGPQIAVSPSSGEPGSSFTVTGSGFDSGDRVKVSWDGGNLGGTSKVGSDGTFRYSGTVPQDAAPGSHTIEAVTVGGGQRSAKTSFSVNSPVTTTTAPTTTTTTAAPTTTTSTVARAPSSTTASSDTPVTAAAPATAGDEPVDSVESEEPEAVVGTPSTLSTLTESPTTKPATSEAASVETGQEFEEQTGQPAERASGTGLAGIVIVVLMLGAGAATLLLWGRKKRAEDEVQPVIPDGESGSAPPPLPVAPTIGSGEWTRRLIDIEAEVELAGVTQAGSGYVGMGWAPSEDGQASAQIWESSDGIDWHPVYTLGSFGGLLAVPRNDGVLVTASERHRPDSSPSSWFGIIGQGWERLARGDDAPLSGVAFEGGVAIEELFVAWGRGLDGPGVWSSSNGSDWSRSELAEDVDLIIAADAELIAFGKEVKSKRSFVARSTDGKSWSRSSDGTRAAFEGVSPASLVSFQGGKVVAGTDLMRGVGAVLVSDDGLGWYRVPFSPGAGTSIEHLATCGGRLLAVGSDTRKRRGGRGTLVVWESTDAVEWEQVEPEELLVDSVGHSVTVAGSSARIWGAVFDDREDTHSPVAPAYWEWMPTAGFPAERDTEPQRAAHIEGELVAVSGAAQ